MVSAGNAPWYRGRPPYCYEPYDALRSRLPRRFIPISMNTARRFLTDNYDSIPERYRAKVKTTERSVSPPPQTAPLGAIQQYGHELGQEYDRNNRRLCSGDFRIVARSVENLDDCGTCWVDLCDCDVPESESGHKISLPLGLDPHRDCHTCLVVYDSRWGGRCHESQSHRRSQKTARSPPASSLDPFTRHVFHQS